MLPRELFSPFQSIGDLLFTIPCILFQFQYLSGNCVGIRRVYQYCAFSCDFGNCGGVGRDDRGTARHCFQQRNPETFPQ